KRFEQGFTPRRRWPLNSGRRKRSCGDRFSGVYEGVFERQLCKISARVRRLRKRRARSKQDGTEEGGKFVHVGSTRDNRRRHVSRRSPHPKLQSSSLRSFCDPASN